MKRNAPCLARLGKIGDGKTGGKTGDTSPVLLDLALGRLWLKSGVSAGANNSS